MIKRLTEDSLPLDVFIKSASTAIRVLNTALFMTSVRDSVPPALLHNLNQNMVLHELNILLTVRIEDVPFVKDERRISTKDLGRGFRRVILHYGFMEDVDVPVALATVTDGSALNLMRTSFSLSRQTLLSSCRPGMAIWRERLFSWMLRNAQSAMEFFKLPTNRVV